MGNADGTIVAQAIELYNGDIIEMDLKEGDLYLFFFELPEYTRDVYFDMYAVGIGIGMMALRKKNLLLRHTLLTIEYHQPMISMSILRDIGTIFTMMNHGQQRVFTGS